MTTPNSTIPEPYKHLTIAKAYIARANGTMAKAPYLGVVSFGRFVPDSGSVTMLTAMVNLPQNSWDYLS